MLKDGAPQSDSADHPQHLAFGFTKGKVTGCTSEEGFYDATGLREVDLDQVEAIPWASSDR